MNNILDSIDMQIENRKLKRLVLRCALVNKFLLKNQFIEQILLSYISRIQKKKTKYRKIKIEKQAWVEARKTYKCLHSTLIIE